MLFHEILKINISVMIPEEFDYTRNKYKKTVEEFVVKDEPEEKCDVYWNSLEKIQLTDEKKCKKGCFLNNKNKKKQNRNTTRLLLKTLTDSNKTKMFWFEFI